MSAPWCWDHILHQVLSYALAGTSHQAVAKTTLFFCSQVGSPGGSFSVEGYYPITILLRTPGKAAKGASRWRSVRFKVRRQGWCRFYFSSCPPLPKISKRWSLCASLSASPIADKNTWCYVPKESSAVRPKTAANFSQVVKRSSK